MQIGERGFGRLRLGINYRFSGLTSVGTEQEMTLADIFARFCSFKRTLRRIAHVVLRELTFHTSLIVDSRPTKVIVRHSIIRYTIFLSHNLGLSGLSHLLETVLILEEPVILVRRSCVIHSGFEAHLEVGYSLGKWTTHVSLFLLRKFVWTIRMLCRSLI